MRKNIFYFLILVLAVQSISRAQASISDTLAKRIKLVTVQHLSFSQRADSTKVLNFNINYCKRTFENQYVVQTMIDQVDCNIVFHFTIVFKDKPDGGWNAKIVESFYQRTWNTAYLLANYHGPIMLYVDSTAKIKVPKDKIEEMFFNLMLQDFGFTGSDFSTLTINDKGAHKMHTSIYNDDVYLCQGVLVEASSSLKNSVVEKGVTYKKTCMTFFFAYQLPNGKWSSRLIYNGADLKKVPGKDM